MSAGLIRSIRTRIIVRLDQFLSWPPFLQIPVIVLLTIALVLAFGLIRSWLTGASSSESLWFALTRFLDGGTMANDSGSAERAVAIVVSVSGVLLLSFLTGAFASKLGERIGELRSGRSPIIAKDHILILGFDSKVQLLVRELARSSDRVTAVVLAKEEKARMDALLRSALDVGSSRLRVVSRTGDPTSEVSLARACADRAQTIVIPAPSKLTDERALQWLVSVLLSVRRAVGPAFAGRVVVESRRAIHGPLIALTGEAGLAGPTHLPIEVFASDDILARVLAQSVRESGIYFALRELLSFEGAEFYVESVPSSLKGRSFEEAHARIDRGIAVGVLAADGSHCIAPPKDALHLRPSDHLIVLEENRSTFTLSGSIPKQNDHAVPLQRLERVSPESIIILGSNRTLPRLIAELDQLLVSGSSIEVRTLATESLPPLEHSRVRVISRRIQIEGAAWIDSAIYEADAVVILGCEEEADPEADASAISLLLQLRHAERSSNRAVKRLITEVRDPIIARQIAGSSRDFLVSTDVVAMLLAQVALDHRIAPIYREILDPSGVEVFMIPRGVYCTDENATFAEIMAAARRRGEIAIGFFPEANDAVRLNPTRDTRIPNGEDVAIVVLANPPDAPQ